ncbi:DBH-like monooxygenase protein 1 (DBH-related protein) (Monooxygenase X) [Durusdinium trenchii]|uniref:DBH-like monooxygenase protein 1 (DBH-related protein) (Monooxygenase X) n=1 Tax=Durusdinium trenchii TaxID=1381693 RepID=A0ABP0K2Y4_9DINO
MRALGLVLMLAVSGADMVEASEESLVKSVVLRSTAQGGAFNVSWWMVNGDTVKLEVFVETDGWFGIGFASKGTMNGADIVLARVASSEDFAVVDCHGVGNTFPVRDESQDYTVDLAERSGDVAHLVLSRSLDTCDPFDYEMSSRSTTRLLWALPGGSTGGDFPTAPHSGSDRGVLSVQLQSPDASHSYDEAADNTTFRVNMLVDQVAIPEYPDGGEGHGPGTTYWCKTFEVNVTEKHHAVKFAPVVQPGNEGRVHHILVYECPEVEAQGHYEGLCYTGANMPSHINSCNGGTVVSGWAVGGEDLVMPPNAGLPIGADSPTHFLMEIHYDNPPGQPAMVDSSGMAIVLTPELREHDVGILSQGHHVTGDMRIPSGRSHYGYDGWCPSECTSSKLEGNINVFGVFLHGHTSAVRVESRHFREGTELLPLAVDNAYDFNYQSMIPVAPTQEVRPGDALLTSCTFNTMERSVVTEGNFDTQSEMCLTYIYFFPKENGFSNCKSGTEAGKPALQCDADVDLLPTSAAPFQHQSSSNCTSDRGCGNGVIDLDLGEECDDGNLIHGDGCDGYCKAENNLFCTTVQGSYTCQVRPQVAKDSSFFVEQCKAGATILGFTVAAFAQGVDTENLGESNPVIPQCPNGIRTCAKEHSQHDPTCRAHFEEVLREKFCCDAAGNNVGGLSSFVTFLASYYCGDENLNVEATCSYCGDGSLQPALGETCDDGNDIDGDGCSAECQIEPEASCTTVEGLSLCRGEGVISGSGSLNAATGLSLIMIIIRDQFF